MSLFCFSADFVEKLQNALPLHLAFKKAPTHENPSHMAWKFEKFIFDLLPLARQAQVLLYPREECFAPLKNSEGPDSPTTVRQALQQLDRLTYRRLSGLEPPEQPFELSQDFDHPTPELLVKWRGRALPPTPYIDP